ncbi:MAG: hypothetical protein WBW36_16825, partial [Candidatus Sulfotelmatobacter sp.]
GALRLFVNRQGWGTDAHRNADSELRGGGGGKNCWQNHEQGCKTKKTYKTGEFHIVSSGPVGLPLQRQHHERANLAQGKFRRGVSPQAAVSLLLSDDVKHQRLE